MITALCGGVGGSKLALGLYKALPRNEFAVVVNTADDLTFCGLHVSPDLDTVLYTLAGISQREFGWGIEGDSFEALDMLGRLGVATWFRVGDRDLAVHVYRSDRLKAGLTLSGVTKQVTEALGVHAKILPMSDSLVATRLLVGSEWVDFQDYFVRRRHAERVERLVYEGIEEAEPGPEVVDTIAQSDVIVIVNSNPLLSILPIVSIAGIRQAMQASQAPKVAVSPIVAGDAVSGPAGELMRLVGQPNSSVGVGNLYKDLIDGLVIDSADEAMTSEVEDLGLAVLSANTLVKTEADKIRLAQEVLDFAADLR